MLPDRWQAAGCYCERKSPERWKLVPLFRRVTQDPLDSTCFIIEANEEILAARNDQGVVRPVVRGAVDMKPIDRPRGNKVAGIVPPGSHSRAANRGHVPSLQESA